MRAAMFVAALLGSAAAFAQSNPAGIWKTIDDSTGKPRGLVEISEKEGVYSGKVIKSFVEDEVKSKVCDKCTDARKDQPIIGMTIPDRPAQVRRQRMERRRDPRPENGKVYKSKMSLADNGSKLNVRGFIGISLLGRTQTSARTLNGARPADAPARRRIGSAGRSGPPSGHSAD